jgi:uncharacterized protein involved in exopolysaccharide biosynthesis
MKKLLPLYILIFAFGAFAQAKKPVTKPVSKQITDLAGAEQLKSLQQQKEALEAERKKLLVEYQPTADEVRAIDKKIAEIDAKLSRAKTSFSSPQTLKLIKLEALKKQKQDAEAQLKTVLGRYTAEHPEVQKIKLQLAEIDEEIKTLLLSETRVELSPELLPDDQTFLLKLLIIQNQRIIELLEKGNPK